jgi:hypothetical protein
MNIILEDRENNYILSESKLIIENHREFIDDTCIAYDRFRYNFPKQDSTKFYRYYNTFCITAGSENYYNLFSELKSNIRYYHNQSDALWLQSWINFHRQSEVLNWHSHYESIFHGYISIDPKSSETEFEKFSIKNQIGNIYIGPSALKHRVNVLESFDGFRITIGFDIFDTRCLTAMQKKYGLDINTAMIPI